MRTEWIRCPVCGNKTRGRIREDTILKNYPLYCPKCRQETLIKAKKTTSNSHPRARRFRRRADEQVRNHGLSALFLYNHRQNKSS